MTDANHRRVITPFAVLLLGTLLPCSAAAAPARVPHRMSAGRTERLVIRARAGLHPHVRHQLVAAQDGREVGSIEALGAAVIEVPTGRVATVARALRRSGYFKSVERDHRAVATEVLPNDPDFPDQWGLSTIGAPTAWDITTGSTTVLVAIVDSGVDATHPDLHTQTVPGYDFINNDADARDDNGHGTRMAGIVAAQAFNGLGIAGTAPGCTLLPVKVLGADGTGPYSAIASGITYAADHGARVINLSLAGTAAADVLQSAVNYATARGAVVVAAAGNFGTGDPVYPAAYLNAVAVSATDANDVVASFSSWGSWVSLAAPGTNILTTNWSAGGTLPYASSSGTSPATAFVSGALALLFSAHPDLTNTGAVSSLTSAAHDIGPAGWDPQSGWGRVDVAVALGASGSTPVPTPSPAPTLTVDRTVPMVSILSPVSSSLVYGTTIVDVAASDNVGVTSVEMLVDNVVVLTDTAPPFGFLWDTTGLSTGRHALRVRAYDAAGNQRLTKRMYVTVTPGVGLLLKRARITPPRIAPANGNVTLSALFSLPGGAALDQGANTFSAVMTSAKGAVFSTVTQDNAFSTDVSGRAQFTVPTLQGGGGLLRVSITRPRNQPNYNLLISGSVVDLSAVDAITNLAVTINGATLSQSITLRPMRSALVSP